MTDWENWQFFEGVRDRHLVYVRPVCVISSVNFASEVSGLCANFEGSQSGVTAESDCLGGQYAS